ncbi:MAG: glycosyltransferase family 39 protein [Myxococcota bacterium]|nr:glycosyltransferase family 39 protein [Myxococcota bacterium]
MNESHENPALGGAEGLNDISTVESADPKAASRWITWLETKVDREKLAVSLVLGLGFLLFFPFLGTLGLWDPWETHYGEVARAMIARDDYVYPYWESSYFFSKPALSLWLMALGLFATGAESGAPGEALGTWSEWGMRTPFALIAIAMMWGVYRIGKQLWDRTTGLICALVLACCPQFIFIGKQAITDGPLVGLLTCALALFIVAVFDDEEERRANVRERSIAIFGIIVSILPQLLLIGRELKSAKDLALLVIPGIIGLAFIAAAWFKASKRDCYLMGFYILVGLAALAKGLAVLAIIGPVVLLYCFLSFDFHLLQRSKFYIGGFLFLAVASPWYVTLTLFKGRDDEGLTFTQRFWFHDNFNRVGSGVHGDRAGLSYFLEQLAYGMFPWSATLPFALGFAARSVSEEKIVRRKRGILFVLIWALWVYVFFTMSLTKFHHYIFPAVPALAILAGGWFTWISRNPEKRFKAALGLIVCALMIVTVRDLIIEPRSLVNLFTYKYDRDFPREIRPAFYILPIVIAGGVATIELFTGFGLSRLLLKIISAPMLLVKWSAEDVDTWLNTKLPKAQKDYALLAFMAIAICFGTWVSHHHFNMLSPHWSQAHLFETFYKEKKGNEPIYAYQLNWRGETFYSRNRVLQVKEKGANQRIRKLVDQPGREFIITEQSRFHTLKNTLSPDKRDKLQIIDRSSNKFYMCVVEE